MKDCTMRSKFNWDNIDGSRSLLSVPQRCEDCESEQRRECIRRSWESLGKKPQDLKISNVAISFNRKMDSAIENADEEKEPSEEIVEEEETLQ